MMYCSQDPDREAVYQKETELRKAARKKKSREEENLGKAGLMEAQAKDRVAPDQSGLSDQGRTGLPAKDSATLSDQDSAELSDLDTPDVPPLAAAGESYLYVAYNLHWERRRLALPLLPAGREWRIAIDTSVDRFSREDEKVIGCGQDEKAKCVDMPGRSIRVLVG